MCTICMSGAQEGKEKMSDLLELMWVELIDQVDLPDGNWTELH